MVNDPIFKSNIISDCQPRRKSCKCRHCKVNLKRGREGIIDDLDLIELNDPLAVYIHKNEYEDRQKIIKKF
jgi:hypothetical protein